MLKALLVCFSLLPAGGLLISAASQAGASAAGQPAARGTGTPAYYNFESGQVRPLALSPSRALLFAANTPDNRIEIFRVTPSGLSRVSEVVVGLEPVALAARSDTEVYVVNHLSDSVSVVDVSAPERPVVRQTLWVGDEPRDLVVAGPGRDRIFVTSAHRGQNRPGDPQLTTPGVGRADVWVFDAKHLDRAPHIITLFTDTPRGLAASPDGRRVYAAGFHSGNQTSTLAFSAVSEDPRYNALIGDVFNAPGMPEPVRNRTGVRAPALGAIVRVRDGRWVDDLGRDWTRRVRFDLPDRDLFTIDAAANPPVEIGAASGIGTILFNVAVNPSDGRVYVSNLEAQNQVRFEPAIKGHIAESRVTIVDGPSVRPVHLNPHIDYGRPSGPPEERERSLAFPLGMEFTRDGSTLYVAAYGSRKVAVLDAGGVVKESIDVGGGPSGLALDERAGRLYVLNRFDQAISIVDTATRARIGSVPLRFDPEPAAIRAGRPLLYDARNSGHGDSACASCHIFGDFDSLAWDLGDPNAEVKANPITRVAIQGVTPLQPLHPMKGPMTTQSLRGMKGAGAMHWRGDRNGGPGDPFSEEKGFMEFLPAFQDLLGMKEPLAEPEMIKFRDFALTVRYPPNPIAALDNSLTPMQAAGKEIFDSRGVRAGLGGDGNGCGQCHTLPFGTDGHGSLEIFPQDMKVAHLRNLYQKVGMFGFAVPDVIEDRMPGQSGSRLQPTPTPHLGNQVRGFGFMHDGAVPTLANFFRLPVRPPPLGNPFTFLDEPGRSGNQKARELESFLLAFDTGLAPAVGQQVTLATSDLTAVPPVRLDRYRLLRDRADAGTLDLVVHGPIGGVARGMLYVRSDGSRSQAAVYQTDRAGERLAWDDLVKAVNGGAVLTMTAVPPGSGARIGTDRDADGFLDRDEADRGADPADPRSVPAP